MFGEDGGHAGNNETAFMLAIDPALVHKERYTGPEMTTANAGARTRGAPTRRRRASCCISAGRAIRSSTPAKAKTYFDKVNAKVEALIADTIRKWNLAGL